MKLLFLTTLQPAYFPPRHQVIHDLKAKQDKVQRCRCIEAGLDSGITPADFFDEENSDEGSNQESDEESEN